MTLGTVPVSRPRLHCRDPYVRARRRTRAVFAGTVGIGGDHPIRLQSMTTTDTLDAEATAAQALRMAASGCELVRVTAPTVKDARSLERIKTLLLRAGCGAPLVADIHFDPSAALEAAEFVEKVRINPGNFVDSKRFAVREYSDAEYARELERIEARFVPLVEKLKRLKRALRIGTNHGSLSDRIMNRYGDTPLGMVESALEYERICRASGFRDIVFSMKASNPKVMIAAYRLLATRLDAEGLDYPFHLGVTEAGDGEDGRVKSAAGIGSLLEDGIGDTIRVSLTEPPEAEIPVCRELAAPYQAAAASPSPSTPIRLYCEDPFDYKRRDSDSLKIGPFRVGGAHPVRVVTRWRASSDAPGREVLRFLEAQLKAAAELEPEILQWTLRAPADLETLRRARAELAGETSRLAHCVRLEGGAVPVVEALALAELAVLGDAQAEPAELIAAVALRGIPLLVESASVARALERERLCRDAGVPALVGLLPGEGASLLHDYRRLAAALADAGSRAPIHVCAPAEAGVEAQTLRSGVLLGSLLCDGIGDSVQLLSELPARAGLGLLYSILQAAGVRITKTEYVSCPSCGRTLFDLQETTERIKAQTGHLKGVKIAIMGCIVNGPGEMADADFGYVGGAPDRINLYVGKDCVRKGIPTEVADRALIDLIKSHGKWSDPR